MPMTKWEDIVGRKCKKCTRPATHWYGSTPICCTCHTGNMVCNKEATCIHWLFRLLQPDDGRCDGLTFEEDEVYDMCDSLLETGYKHTGKVL